MNFKKNIAGPEKSGQVETWPTWPVATALRIHDIHCYVRMWDMSAGRETSVRKVKE